MGMELTHRFVVPATLDEAWAAFNDLDRIGGCLPGATITSVDGDDFTGTVKVKLGPISLQYSGSGSYIERDEAGRKVVIKASGKDKRGNGTASVTITATMAEEAGGTAVDVLSDLGITGKPAQFGRGVMQDVSDKLLGLFIECIKDKLGSADTDDAENSVSVEQTKATWTSPDQPVEPSRNQDTPPVERSRNQDPSPVERSRNQAESNQPDAELDFFNTVAPVLAKRYAKPAIAALGGIAVFVVLRRLLGGRG